MRVPSHGLTNENIQLLLTSVIIKKSTFFHMLGQIVLLISEFTVSLISSVLIYILLQRNSLIALGNDSYITTVTGKNE
jgi:hypothetical protein